ncbi:hypothetical protein [Dongshaea marina]|uniref:hypothetical protein n=1 Tax=Dongshaea marina TaxID=2047966 RepID=UPI000D3EAE3F|nr:hypothetical protein [Dongshaea marina]
MLENFYQPIALIFSLMGSGALLILWVIIRKAELCPGQYGRILEKLFSVWVLQLCGALFGLSGELIPGHWAACVQVA